MSQHLTLIARLTAKPEHADALGKGLQQLIAPTSLEAGSLGYVLHRDNNDPNVWILYETWVSQADLDAHFKYPYTKELMARFPGLLAKEMELTYCSVVAPTGSASSSGSPGNS
jgi:quinol monooxygenase YgiN